MILDEYGKAMDVMLVAINKRYVMGTVPWVDGQPELSNRAQELEQRIAAVWNDGLSIERFKELLRECHQFWLRAIKEYKGRKT